MPNTVIFNFNEGMDEGDYIMKFRPLHDRILVERAEAETVTAGGIILPDSSKEKPTQGTVLRVGNGYVKDDGSVRALDVNEGETVMFAEWAGTEVKIDGEKYTILKESDVIGVLDK